MIRKNKKVGVQKYDNLGLTLHLINLILGKLPLVIVNTLNLIFLRTFRNLSHGQEFQPHSQDIRFCHWQGTIQLHQ